MFDNESPLIRLEVHSDDRGNLVALEGEDDLPFQIRRVYYIFGVPSDCARGFHAHRELRQLMISTSGSCIVTLDDGTERQDYRLDMPGSALLVDRMVWREMRDFSADCVLLVLASEHYDERDYIFSYDEFLRGRRQLANGNVE